MIIVDGIETRSNHAALTELAHLAERVHVDHAVVAVGVFRGGTLRVIAQATRATVFGVDSWKYSENKTGSTGELSNLAHAQRAITGLDHTHLIRGHSPAIAHTYDGPAVGLLYLDQQHACDAVVRDFHAWRPYLTPDAVIAFNNYRPDHPGILDAVQTLADQHLINLIGVVGDQLALTWRRPRPAHPGG